MLFDNRTLFLAFFCVSTTMAAALAGMWRVKPTSRALALMAGADVVLSIAALLIGFRGLVPNILSLFVSNGLLVVGLLVATEAFRSHCALPARLRLDIGIFAVTCSGMLYFGLFFRSFIAEVLFFSAGSVVAAMAVAVDLFRASGNTAKPGALAAAGQFTAFGAMMALRAVFTPTAGEFPSLLGTASPVHVMATVLAIIASISVNLTLMWMVFTEAEHDLRHANADLKRSNAELDRFAAIVSHDLKSPLGSVTGYIGLARAALAEGDAARPRGYLDSAEDGAMRMGTLIDEILAYSRFRRSPSETGPVDLRAACQAAIENLAVRINGSAVSVDVGPLPTATGDRAQYVRLFQNLVENAIKYRAPSRPCLVRIAAAREGRHWKVSVADNGVGIAPSDCHRVFETFWRKDANPDADGIGLGLGICRQIVERHGGRIWVESEPGAGSTFFFTVPSATRSQVP